MTRHDTSFAGGPKYMAWPSVADRFYSEIKPEQLDS